MNDLIVQLASDLDAFAYDYDYYGYMDAIDDRKQAVEDMKNDLISGKYVDGIIEFLNEVVDEHDPDWEPKAQALIDRVKALYR